MKDRLKLYEAVNSSETAEELCKALDMISNGTDIKGRVKMFDATKMKDYLKAYINDDHNIPNVITREFGLRQQAMYIKHYEQLKISDELTVSIQPYGKIGESKNNNQLN